MLLVRVRLTNQSSVIEVETGFGLRGVFQYSVTGTGSVTLGNGSVTLTNGPSVWYHRDLIMVRQYGTIGI